MHLLVIEDERALCETIVRSLRRLAYSVDFCCDGERALELLGKHLGMFDAKSGREEADALEKLDRLLEGIGDAAAE